MGLFHIVDDAYVVTQSKGIYRQAKLFQRDGKLYAGWSGGYVRLLAGGGTTSPQVSWLEIEGVAVQTDRLLAPVLKGPAGISHVS